MKDNCDGKCTHCNETQLPNIKDKNCDGIGYSYAYKTDCAGDRYIKIDEVRYLLQCERNKAIDDLMEKVSECFISGADWNYLVQEAGQLKAGGENES